MRILFLGGNGQVGSAFFPYFSQKGHDVIRPERFDIRIPGSVTKAIEEYQPSVVINFVAQANIDICEENKLTAFDINTLGADVVAEACQKKNVYLIHISTGCIQESLTPEHAHNEESQATPLCFYSWTKYFADQMVQHRMKRNGLRALILRPRQLLSSELSPRNALTKMLTYTKFIDTPNSCTVVDDLVWVTEELIVRGVTGTYNVANPGVTSPLKIATILREIIKPDMKIEPITKAQLNAMTKAERIDAVLDCSKLFSLGIKLEPVDVRLRKVISDLKQKIDSEAGVKLMEKVRQETIWKLTKV